MGLTLCNSYPVRISTAIMFYSPETCGGDGRDFEIMGWWVLNPGSCALVYANDLEDLNRFWYYFAFGSDGAQWSRPFTRSVPLRAFGQCWGLATSAPEATMSIGLRELDIGDNDDFTLTFVA